MIESVLFRVCLILSLAAPSVSYANLTCAKNFKRILTSNRLEKSNYQIDFRNPKKDEVSGLNTLIVAATGRYFIKFRSLPNREELISHLEKEAKEEFGARASSQDRDQLVYQVIDGKRKVGSVAGAIGNTREALMLALYHPVQGPKIQNLLDKAQKVAVAFFVKEMRPPNLTELQELTEIPNALLKTLAEDWSTFWIQAVENHRKEIDKLRRKIVRYYLSTIRNERHVGAGQLLPPQLPTTEGLFAEISRKDETIRHAFQEGTFTFEQFEVLIGVRKQRSTRAAFRIPVLFQGLNRISLTDPANLERFAKTFGMTLTEASERVKSGEIRTIEDQARRDPKNGRLFKNVQQNAEFNRENSEAIVELLKTHRGFLAVTAVAGIPLNKGQLETMLRYAEEKDLFILVGPALGIIDGLPEVFWEHPKIRVLTNTIETEHLLINAVPIQSKMDNPFASSEKGENWTRGVTDIRFTPQLKHRVVATRDNRHFNHDQWTTGAITQNIYPTEHPIQARLSDVAKQRHHNGFLVVEKSDAQSGTESRGTPGVFHVRNVMWFEEVEPGRKEPGFVDLGWLYTPKKKERYEPEALVPGDLHNRVTDPEVVKILVDVIHKFPELEYLLLHDPLDGTSHNRHERDRKRLLMERFKAGDLDIRKELEDLIGTLNGFYFAAMQAKNNGLRIVFPWSNHSVWIGSLLEDGKFQNDPVNGEIITELVSARTLYGISNPLEYYLKHRMAIIERLPKDVRDNMFGPGGVPHVEYPERLEILTNLSQFVRGSEQVPVHLEPHGHQGAGGKRGSPAAHQAAMKASVSGDSHTPFIEGGAFNAGVLQMEMRYAEGGYSGWSLAMVLVYRNGMRQLLKVNPLARQWQGREDKGTIKDEGFFPGGIRIRENDNDVMEGKEAPGTFDNVSFGLKVGTNKGRLH